MIKYFLVETKDVELKVPDVKELKDVKWYPQQQALETLGYDNAKEIFHNGLKRLGLE